MKENFANTSIQNSSNQICNKDYENKCMEQQKTNNIPLENNIINNQKVASESNSHSESDQNCDFCRKPFNFDHCYLALRSSIGILKTLFLYCGNNKEIYCIICKHSIQNLFESIYDHLTHILQDNKIPDFDLYIENTQSIKYRKPSEEDKRILSNYLLKPLDISRHALYILFKEIPIPVKIEDGKLVLKLECRFCHSDVGVTSLLKHLEDSHKK